VTDHPHIEVFRRTYAAFSKGDMKALAEVFAENVVRRQDTRHELRPCLPPRGREDH
jgi:ketosteroid isomerase-like protein